MLADDSLNVAREHVYCGNDEHVVFSAQNMDPAVRSAAGAFCVVDSTDIACAETDERTRVLSERCEYQLTNLTRLQNLTGVDVNGFNQNMILGDVKSVLSLAHCGAGAENVR